MHTLEKWEARRAGGRITITGTDASTGEARKLVGVDRIVPAPGLTMQCHAVDKHGVRHRLNI